ncbi:uncharacterized protein TNCV_1808871 [Trichonephila clavipes]|nr:uncharacterized protein TNCV_1808871 [Trichonephila clavipes]
MDVCKCIVHARHGGTLNSRRAASPLVRLVEGEGRWKASDHPQSVLPLIWGGIEPNRTVTCMVLKDTANDMRHLALCHIEFRGPRSGLCRSELRFEIASSEIWFNPCSGDDEALFWLNGYVNKQNCRIRSEANPQVYVETPLHPEKVTVWCALWVGGILLQKRRPQRYSQW